MAAAAAATKVSWVWLPYWDLTNAYRAVVADADLIRTASPFWYAAGSCTSVTGRPGAGRTAVIDGLHARAIAVVPTIAVHDRPVGGRLLLRQRRRPRGATSPR